MARRSWRETSSSMVAFCQSWAMMLWRSGGWRPGGWQASSPTWSTSSNGQPSRPKRCASSGWISCGGSRHALRGALPRDGSRVGGAVRSGRPIAAGSSRLRSTARSPRPDGRSGLGGTLARIEREGASEDTLAFIDAPLAIANPARQRPCEKQVGQRHWQFKVSANSTNLASPRQAGVRLRQALEVAEWRYDGGIDGPRSHGRTVSESSAVSLPTGSCDRTVATPRWRSTLGEVELRTQRGHGRTRLAKARTTYERAREDGSR